MLHTHSTSAHDRRSEEIEKVVTFQYHSPYVDKEFLTSYMLSMENSSYFGTDGHNRDKGVAESGRSIFKET